LTRFINTYNSVKLKSKRYTLLQLEVRSKDSFDVVLDSIHIDLVIEMENLKLLTLKSGLEKIKNQQDSIILMK
jgi:hypothetical protein